MPEIFIISSVLMPL